MAVPAPDAVFSPRLLQGQCTHFAAEGTVIPNIKENLTLCEVEVYGVPLFRKPTSVDFVEISITESPPVDKLDNRGGIDSSDLLNVDETNFPAPVDPSTPNVAVDPFDTSDPVVDLEEPASSDEADSFDPPSARRYGL
ncbi:UNVERIFIED_CONTAM: hypothetical protein FKN15_026580 [Acipenser sinensis]